MFAELNQVLKYKFSGYLQGIKALGIAKSSLAILFFLDHNITTYSETMKKIPSCLAKNRTGTVTL